MADDRNILTEDLGLGIHNTGHSPSLDLLARLGGKTKEQAQPVQPQDPLSAILNRSHAVTQEAEGQIGARERQMRALMGKPIDTSALTKAQEGMEKSTQALADLTKKGPEQLKPNWKQLGMLLVPIIALGSMMMKNHARGAMIAMTGFMQGYAGGRRQKMDEARQQYKDALSAAIEQNHVEVQKYQSAMEGYHLSMQERMNEMQIIAAETRNDVMMEHIKRGEISDAIRLVEHQERQGRELEKHGAAVLKQMDGIRKGLETEYNLAHPKDAVGKRDMTPERFMAQYGYRYNPNVPGGLEQVPKARPALDSKGNPLPDTPPGFVRKNNKTGGYFTVKSGIAYPADLDESEGGEEEDGQNE